MKKPKLLITLGCSLTEGVGCYDYSLLKGKDDLKRFKYLKRLMNRYEETGDLSERLVLNHLIVVFNAFGIEASLNILELKMNKTHWPILKPFLIFLKYIRNDQYTKIPMDPVLVEALRKI